MAGIFENIFGKAPVQNQIGTTPPGNIPAAAPTQASTPGNGVVPANAVTNPAESGAENKSPLDEFSKLWETDPNAATGPSSILNVDPKKLAEAASKRDFVKSVPAELLQKFKDGGEGSIEALSQILNKVAQGGYAQSTFTTAQIVETALAKQQEAFLSKLPDIIKKHNVSDNLRTKNPIFNHPAASPILEALQTQLATKHPNATATELQAMSESYLTSLANAANPPKQDDSKSSKETDWSSFLTDL